MVDNVLLLWRLWFNNNLCKIAGLILGLFRFVMARDIRNVIRGRCDGCKSCSSFLSCTRRVICDYCGCPPAQHVEIREKRVLKRRATSPSPASSPKGSENSASPEISSDFVSGRTRQSVKETVSRQHLVVQDLADDSTSDDEDDTMYTDISDETETEADLSPYLSPAIVTRTNIKRVGWTE